MSDSKIDKEKLDHIVAENRRFQDQRENSYRERALKMYPWICGRCSREFNRKNITELTVHHRDHDHDNNPADGSNWELLCMYCQQIDNHNHQSTNVETGFVLVTEYLSTLASNFQKPSFVLIHGHFQRAVACVRNASAHVGLV